MNGISVHPLEKEDVYKKELGSLREQLEVKEEAIKQNTVHFLVVSERQVEVSSLKEKLARVESNLQQVATPSVSDSSEEILVGAFGVCDSRSGCRVFVGFWSGCSRGL